MTWILYGWKFKSKCKIRLTLVSDSPSFLEWRTADRRGLCSNDALTASLFCGVRTVFNTTTFLLHSWAGLLKVVLPSLWHELTALYCFDESRISCEIHVGWQRSYRSYKMILWRKHSVHQSIIQFQTECYSWPHHLAASFPFPTHAKNRKTPLPNRPIHWRTLYVCVCVSPCHTWAFDWLHHWNEINRQVNF